MFLCIFGEVVSYLYYSKRPRKLIDGSISTTYPHKEQKEEREKRLPHRCFPPNFVEFLRTQFLRTFTVATSED